jgi:hypothetical protein
MAQTQNNVPAVGAGGASGGPGNRTPAIKIVKYGRNTGARDFEKRYLYIYIEPFDNNDLNRGIEIAVDTLNRLLTVWRPPMKASMFRSDMWWEHVRCDYCKRRAEYELEKWKRNEYVWTRRMCMRHWLVYHLSMITPNEPLDLLSNRPISIEANDREIIFSIETINYKYNIRLNKEVAEMEVEYKGKIYRFTFRNHMDGFPYISSYMNILHDMHATMDVFKMFLTDYVQKRRLYSNVIINNSITLPPSSPTNNYNVCRIKL